MVRTVVRNGVTRKPWGQGRAAQQRYQRNRTAFDVAQLIKARMDVDQVQMTGQLFPRGSMKKLANKELLDWVHTFNGRVWTKPMLKQIIRVLLRTIDVPMDPSKTFGNFVNQQSKRLGYLIRQAKRLKELALEDCAMDHLETQPWESETNWANACGPGGWEDTWEDTQQEHDTGAEDDAEALPEEGHCSKDDPTHEEHLDDQGTGEMEDWLHEFGSPMQDAGDDIPADEDRFDEEEQEYEFEALAEDSHEGKVGLKEFLKCFGEGEADPEFQALFGGGGSDVWDDDEWADWDPTSDWDDFPTLQDWKLWPDDTPWQFFDNESQEYCTTSPEQNKAMKSMMKQLIYEGVVSETEWPRLREKWFKEDGCYPKTNNKTNKDVWYGETKDKQKKDARHRETDSENNQKEDSCHGETKSENNQKDLAVIDDEVMNDRCSKDWCWMLLDVCVVFSSLLEFALDLQMHQEDSSSNAFSNMRLLRVLRVAKVTRALRIVRVVKFVRSLKSLLFCIGRTLRALAWSLVLLMLIVFVFGLIFTDITSEYLTQTDTVVDPITAGTLRTRFGGLELSMHTLYGSITGGFTWVEARDAFGEISFVWGILFEGYISFCLFAVLNVMTGVFCHSAIESADKDHEMNLQILATEREKYFRAVKRLFARLDADADGGITATEFEVALQDKTLISVFDALEISVEDAWNLFRTLDSDGDSHVGPQEFIDGCLRLKGPARSIDVVCIKRDLNTLMQKLDTQVEEMTHIKKKITRAD